MGRARGNDLPMIRTSWLIAALAACGACTKPSDKQATAVVAEAPAADPHGSTVHGKVEPHVTAIAQPGEGGGAGAGGAEPTAADGTKNFAAFSLKVPKDWKETPPTSGMRADTARMIAPDVE